MKKGWKENPGLTPRVKPTGCFKRDTATRSPAQSGGLCRTKGEKEHDWNEVHAGTSGRTG
nr:MAG TPA: hypothetical protein [Caudoviricetes sp.]